MKKKLLANKNALYTSNKTYINNVKYNKRKSYLA